VVADQEHPRLAVTPDEMVAGARRSPADQPGAEGGHGLGAGGGVTRGRLDGDQLAEVVDHAGPAAP